MDDIGVDLIFPPRVIPALRYLRGPAWQDLIARLADRDSQDMELLAFVVMMVRMSGCTTCQADSFKAMRGCTQCSIQTIRRFRGSDQELLGKYADAITEINRYYHEE